MRHSAMGQGRSTDEPHIQKMELQLSSRMPCTATPARTIQQTVSIEVVGYNTVMTVVVRGTGYRVCSRDWAWPPESRAAPRGRPSPHDGQGVTEFEVC